MLVFLAIIVKDPPPWNRGYSILTVKLLPALTVKHFGLCISALGVESVASVYFSIVMSFCEKLPAFSE